MEAELNKFTFNGLAVFISPGAIIQLFILWGIAILFPNQPNYFKNYELFAVFMFLIAAYLTGSLINAMGEYWERKILMRNGYNPRMKALNGKHHWIEDLDRLYFKGAGLNIYDFNKETNKPKPGTVNGKKINLNNLSQFERFANFYIKKYGMNESVEMQKEKYLLFRNLGLSLIICAILILVYLAVNLFKPVFSMMANDVFYNTAFVIIVFALLVVLGIILFVNSKKQRVIYLEDLYRTARYCYFLQTVN
ncbi:MAG TPA: hypothetical protein VHB48_02350 [Chitinophagaceae bacterium]|nr:hypothetical protein [Chitinophagaceae bacterium]